MTVKKETIVCPRCASDEVFVGYTLDLTIHANRPDPVGVFHMVCPKQHSELSRHGSACVGDCCDDANLLQMAAINGKLGKGEQFTFIDVGEGKRGDYYWCDDCGSFLKEEM